VRVERLQSDFDIDIKYRHFPLHPDTPETGITLEELFAGRNIDIPATQTRMANLMAEEGLPFGDRSMTYNSRLAQEMAKWAETQKTEGNVHDALFQAYFVENVNLAKINNLIVIAEQIGLPASKTEKVLVERQFREAVDADWKRSRELGITGVPTFVVGNQGLVGAQSYEQLEALVMLADAQRRPRTPCIHGD
jgi:predicted DsbA family dithiol-disulfide isomerase